ncbi:uncharacterized protein K452DRAFT_131906 [Aplosporella prunicola CBS 121167]|uniref:Uncharacterized protein n=1 Tax=Aplosporella prunicola CBS 121167 TaxID=1176127 RepID=A0A6A6BNA5_9PEZI|nr:uncharacterized protein K452DRAFT_131906 [Aplosporella prunicola CBS 121167]KAF2144903.1 hypothetical protein K452DRAFT_131906 [Aplosporella prunicola CBS 121167]
MSVATIPLDGVRFMGWDPRVVGMHGDLGDFQNTGSICGCVEILVVLFYGGCKWMAQLSKLQSFWPGSRQQTPRSANISSSGPSSLDELRKGTKIRQSIVSIVGYMYSLNQKRQTSLNDIMHLRQPAFTTRMARY